MIPTGTAWSLDKPCSSSSPPWVSRRTSFPRLALKSIDPFLRRRAEEACVDSSREHDPGLCVFLHRSGLEHPHPRLRSENGGQQRGRHGAGGDRPQVLRQEPADGGEEPCRPEL